MCQRQVDRFWPGHFLEPLDRFLAKTGVVSESVAAEKYRARHFSFSTTHLTCPNPTVISKNSYRLTNISFPGGGAQFALFWSFEIPKAGLAVDVLRYDHLPQGNSNAKEPSGFIRCRTQLRHFFQAIRFCTWLPKSVAYDSFRQRKFLARHRFHPCSID